MKRLVLLLVLATSVLAGACGDDGGGKESGVATLDEGAKDDKNKPADAKNKDAEAAMLAFSQCMRENGVNLPDPSTEGGNVGFEFTPGGDMTPEKMRKAQEACKDKREALQGVVGPMPGAGGEDAMGLAFARCMRDKGWDVPDPKTTEDGGSFSFLPDSIDTSDPKFKQAQDECRKQSEPPKAVGGK